MVVMGGCDADNVIVVCVESAVKRGSGGGNQSAAEDVQRV